MYRWRNMTSSEEINVGLKVSCRTLNHEDFSRPSDFFFIFKSVSSLSSCRVWALYQSSHNSLRKQKRLYTTLFAYLQQYISKALYIWMCEIRGRWFLKFEIEKIFSICVTTGNTSFPYVLGGTPGQSTHVIEEGHMTPTYSPMTCSHRLRMQCMCRNICSVSANIYGGILQPQRARKKKKRNQHNSKKGLKFKVIKTEKTVMRKKSGFMFCVKEHFKVKL